MSMGSPLPVSTGSSPSVLPTRTTIWPASPTTVQTLLYLLLVSKSRQPGTPLVPVVSRWNVSPFNSRTDGRVRYLDGSSMAAAHVVGLLTYSLSVRRMGPEDMFKTILYWSNKGVLRLSNTAMYVGTPNRLVRNDIFLGRAIDEV